jgi:hypothetical protein
MIIFGTSQTDFGTHYFLLMVASGGKLWEMEMEYSIALFLCPNMDC